MILALIGLLKTVRYSGCTFAVNDRKNEEIALGFYGNGLFGRGIGLSVRVL